MNISRRGIGAATAGLAGLGLPHAARAQGVYPSRAVTIVAPFAAGGSTDFVARLLAQQLQARLGQSFVVDNRTGGSGTVGTATVARARPDGYTLLLSANSTFAIAPFLYSNLPYDNDHAFTPVGLFATNGMFVCVKSNNPARTLQDLIARAKAEPGKLSFGSGGAGVTNHLSVEILSQFAGIELLHVPYRGGGPAVQALLAGEVQLSFVDTVTAVPYLQSGDLRALAVTTAQRAAQAPEVPTVAETGLKGYQTFTDFALFAPAGTPEAVVARLSAACIEAVRSDEVKARLTPLAIEPVAGTPAEFPAYMEREGAKWRDIIRARNIRLD